MSERPLPDDPARWPDDPCELLGVSPSVTPRELRRAYHRLIRVYKPEQAPEEFRRIREAYERLLATAELFGTAVEWPAAASESESPPDLDDADGTGSSHPATEQPPSGPRCGPGDEIDELWEAAADGRAMSAYERLVGLVVQHAGRTELYLRLYWLLDLYPEVEARRAPVDWLVQGLLANGLGGTLLGLYREVVADDPAEALSERYRRVLDEASGGLLVDLAEARFRAASRLERWDVLSEDFATLRLRFGPDEEQLWLRLVFALADAVACAGDAAGVQLLADCRDEINRHQHLAFSLSHSFDRFELLTAATTGWLEVMCHGRVPTLFVRLLGASWSRPLAELRSALLEVMESVAASPQLWLDYLDNVDERAPAVLALFGELLDRFEEDSPTRGRARDRAALEDMVLAFLPRLNFTDYNGERRRLLMFCVREDLAPEEMAAVAAGFTGGGEALGTAWARALAADWPLRHVCRAVRLFWA